MCAHTPGPWRVTGANVRAGAALVAIVGTLPRERAGVLYSVKTFDDMLGPWRQYYAAPAAGGAP